MRVSQYDPKTQKVLSILRASPTPIAMPEITYLACCLGDYYEMEVRQIVWRLISHNAVESVGNLKFQPSGGCGQSNGKWLTVINEKRGVEEAQDKLKKALIDLVSD